MKPALSVIVPVYAAELYIKDCVRSLFSQTLEDVEYIFVDDCSPDQSISIIKDLLIDYPNRIDQVKFIYNEKNLGQALSREKGRKVSKSKYITFCDSDDWVEVDMYERMLKTINETGSQIVLCDMISDSGYRYKGYNTDSTDILSDLLSERIVSFIPSAIIDKSLFYNSLIELTSANLAEDLVLSLSLAYYAEKIAYIEKPFYHYRFNQQSTSRKQTRNSYIKRAEDIKKNTDLIISFLCQNGLEKKYEQEILLRKHIVKNAIWPVVGNMSAYHLWRNLYPEIHCEILRNRNYSFRTKLLYVLTILGIYPLYLKLTKK